MNNELDDFLKNRADQERKKSNIDSETLSIKNDSDKVTSSAKIIDVNDSEISKMPTPGLFAPKELKEAAKAKNKGMLLAAETQLQMLRNRCDAALKEDLAFWDGKSEEVKSRIDAYVTAAIQDIHFERSKKKMDIVSKIYEFASNMVTKSLNNPAMPEFFRNRLANEIMDEMDRVIQQVKDEDNKR